MSKVFWSQVKWWVPWTLGGVIARLFGKGTDYWDWLIAGVVGFSFVMVVLLAVDAFTNRWRIRIERVSKP